jgi:hypothetical protein
MRRTVLTAATAVALVGPTALAFAAGGYNDRPRLIAGIVAWSLFAVAVLAGARPLPRRRPGRLAFAGLALLAAWIGLSLAWAPIAGPAFHDAQRAVLYLGALGAAAALLHPRAAARAAEPVLAAGTVVVIGYGLSERLLPGAVHLVRTFSAAGRLDQPLGYWNAMGALAALGLVLSARVAGDRTRPDGLRIAAAGAAPVLGMGIYLSFSRGALAALAAGLVVLTVLAPNWPQLRSTLVAVGGGAVAALTASRFDGVQSLAGDLAHRERQGAIALVVLLVLVALAAGFQRRASRAERAGRLRAGAIPLPRRTPAIAAALVVLIAAGVAFAAARESRSGGAPPRGANAARLSSLQSHRYEYWKVAVRTFAHNPVVGVGASGFAVEWLRHRPFREPAQDAHSLYLETAAELGLVGLVALALMLAGIALAAREAWRRDPVLASGACAALTAWALHAGLDWDWEMPGLTLVAIVLAGLVIATADDGDNERSP